MAPLAVLWTKVIFVFDLLTGTARTPGLQGTGLAMQTPLGSPELRDFSYPIINPPDEEPREFRCEYPDFPESEGWEPCNTNDNRKCWLRNTVTGKEYNISTDYENDGPRGVVRHYYLELNHSMHDPDGNGMVYTQTFNNSFPGPRLFACWGDQIQVTVKNLLSNGSSRDEPGNGTTVHWHGFRQWKTGQMDGVNAVTQCPIPPNGTFTYTFNATQYGTSWYHSHYSLQYAAGALGGFTVYGPMSHDFDHQVAPIIMSDWVHESLYGAWERSLEISEGKRKGDTRIYIDNILQNGIGHWPPIKTDEPIPAGTQFNEMLFQRGTRYLLRLINGAADTTFVFSIDNHNLTVTSTDFIPITPYETDHVVIGIGQRYNVIVHALPIENTKDVNFWMRTTPADRCAGFRSLTKYPDTKLPDSTTGIVRYNHNDRQYPTTVRQNFSLDCTDETYFRNLTPVVQWQVSKSRQTVPNLYLSFTSKSTGFPYYPCKANPGRFELVTNQPAWLNFSNPPLLNAQQNFDSKPWLTVVDTGTTTEDRWIQLNIISGARDQKRPSKPHPIHKQKGVYVPSQHPIHLHGHDFAVLDQCVPDDDHVCDLAQAELTLNNPPRRDVAFLPDGGYLIIAFKADNPGAWIMHCHIAFHASMGLAAQILENVAKWPSTFGFGWDEVPQDICNSWNGWMADHGHNISDPCMLSDPNGLAFQTDSGI